jgi:hypothetical protein
MRKIIRNSKKLFSRKSKKNLRKTKKQIRKSKKTHSRKSRKPFRGGGNWINYTDNIVEHQPTCPICTESFGDNPDKAIYITDCKHLFHNDCLFELCEHNQNSVCPICRAELDMTCMDVWAFKKKALGRMDGKHLFNGNDEILNIYNTQPES